MQKARIPITKLTGGIYRNTLEYTNEVFKKYSLGSGTYPYLMILYNKEGISQNQISKELAVDKALSARVIKKLIDLDYIRKETNTKDSRAYCLYLTDKAKAIIPAMKEELGIWNEIMTQNLTEEEKDNITDILSKVLGNIKKYRLENEESD
ncbi:DNA-binding MarR family transcriptional regulator [Kineothrix alysoides]|uniref:DNA-binding MarR family transcriptional regulator n=1 Tax=Kineothrix alysoides TaxID=1469948 RepID=A0A4V2QCF3_9FIRM|nr:MarR family transcriptional regulator [Kineothrix alysoides]TCL60027.1 DNA-binding MarR family transcriptional regulator [Kineothrix alysoides]